ncbi:PucR family transcriptional regulator ligand-binding domain-containing protein, partial [Streptomyces sp. NPDC089915]|uniref:PucR family transcriptional regulator ligand-binding domain-containing protein n=1 Tax=Streptomyces sp. NPDC089915 TaxID=3155186 RepID=UPI0034403E7A
MSDLSAPGTGPQAASSAPAGEPMTPPVGLAGLLGEQGLGLRHLAGPAVAEVHGVHASEMADPSPYLLGGELLLTAGSALAEAGAAAYVDRLARAGAAALGFGVTPVHEVVPAGLAEACERYGLPLVEVPPGTPFTAVARTVWRLMAEARTRELRRVTEAQQSLASAAARPDPVPAVLSRLATALGGWAALWEPGPPGAAGPGGAAGGEWPGAAGQGPRPAGAAADTAPGSGPSADRRRAAGTGTTVETGTGGDAAAASASGIRPVRATAGVEPGDEVRGALAGLALRVAPGGAATATDSLGGTQLAAYAVGGGQVLVLATPGRAPGDHTIASVAAVLLSLLTASRPAGAEAAALTRLLLDGDPAAALAPGPWYAVRARGGGDPHALATALGTVLLDPRGDGVRLLTDREPGPQPGWRLGVSAPAGPVELSAADAQASARARARRAWASAADRWAPARRAASTDSRTEAPNPPVVTARSSAMSG